MREAKTKNFEIKYIESELDCPILWENHCHAKYEMIAVISGNVTVVLEGQKYCIQKNQVIIIPPLFYHSITANEKGTYRRITALFDIDFIPLVIQDNFKWREKCAFIDAYCLKKLKRVSQDDNSDFYLPLLESLMIEMLYDFLQSPQANASVEADEFLQKTFQYIDLHLCEKISLDELARHTLKSKSSFCHLFEAKMNISPKQYILQKKLALASKFISEGMPPTVAATRVGYGNYSNFYRLYRKAFGKSPMQRAKTRAD